MARYLITGASRGIGRCLIDLLADPVDGHELVALGRTADSLAGLPVSHRIVADLGRPDSMAGPLAALADRDGAGGPFRLDGLIHCAGIARRADLASSTPADWSEQLAVNVIGAGELTRLLLPMLRAAGGTVVFVNSGQGLNAMPGSTVYAATKHALRSLADTLRAEEPAIRVSSIFPGRVATDMQRELRAQEGGAYEPERYLRPETVAAAIVHILATPPDAVVTDMTLRPARP